MEYQKEILDKYEFIKYYYSKYINQFLEINHPLIIDIKNDAEFLKILNEYLRSLNALNNLPHLIKKSTDSNNFLSIISEIKTAYLLNEKVDNFEIITSKNSSPDFKIKQSNIEITLEVKMISDKFSNKELMKNEYKINLPNGLNYVYQIDDISTIFNSIEKSIKKGQYYSNISHILVIDCNTTTIEDDEFIDILYSQKNIQMKDDNGGLSFSKYDGLFYEKLENDFKYHMISGVVALFGIHYFNKNRNEIRPKRLKMIFFGNPNASEKLTKDITTSLGFQVHKSNFSYKK